jgi:hypothetical protein
MNQETKEPSEGRSEKAMRGGRSTSEKIQSGESMSVRRDFTKEDTSRAAERKLVFT